MKIWTCLLFLLITFSISAQSEKGVSPIPNTSIPNTQSTTYAVVVGISDYQDEGIPDLRFADKDAEAFAGFLQSPAGGSLDNDHLKVLINEKATGAQFAKALDWLWEVVGENDRVIIYFSGHGDVEKKSITQPGYLLGWDAPSRVYMAGGAMNVRDLNDVVSTLSIQNKAKVILITDACRSGKLSGSGIGGSQATAANLAKQFANEIKILSCQPDEYSIEGEQWGGGRGAFSYHLLDGLYGMADRNTDQSVNLMEIRGYLEEHVSTEVAPHNQLPMVVGNGREKLTDVFSEILAELKEGKKGQMQLFTETESRGIEDDILAASDTSIVELFFAFQKALEEKEFLFPEYACADFYYEKLSKEPQLERLHSTMRRNYAAVLQDDAQQWMNTLLKSGLKESELRGGDQEKRILIKYPAYLERAAELLGEDHYMYNTLQARKYYFKGKTEWQKSVRRSYFHKALQIQPEMPHALVGLIQEFERPQKDSAEYYFHRVREMVPSWIEPYNSMFLFYHHQMNDPKMSEAMLMEANQLDSSSAYVAYWMAWFYAETKEKQYDKAVFYLNKAIRLAGNDICFPCAFHNMGAAYRSQQRYEEAEFYYRKAIETDPTFARAYNGLGQVFKETKQFEKAEESFKKAIQTDSFFIPSYSQLARLYYNLGRYEEAEINYKKAIEIDSQLNPENTWLYNQLSRMYRETGQYKEAEKQLKKAILIDPEKGRPYEELGYNYILTGQYEEAEKQLKKAILLDPDWPWSYSDLGYLYINTGQYEEAEKQLKKAIQIDSTNGNFGGILGNYYTHQHGHLEDAKKELDKAVELTPNSPDIQIYLAQWYIKKNKLEQAWQHLEQGLEMDLGRVYLQLKDLEDGPDFEMMRKEVRWKELMKKYFPYLAKD